MAYAKRKNRANRAAQQSQQTQTQQVPYSNYQEDEPTFYSIYDRPKKPRKPFLSTVADWVDKVGEAVFSPDFGVILGRLISWGSLLVGCLFYGKIIIPIAISQLSIPVFGWWIGAGFSIAIALGIQALEIWPRRFKYFPKLADRAAYKAGLERFTNPKENPNASTMLPVFKFWARTADARKLRSGEIVSGIVYLLEASGAIIALGYVIISNASPEAKLGALFWAAITVLGCEAGLWMSENAKTGRLNARQEASYRAEQDRLELQGMQDMTQNQTTIDV